MKQTAHKGTTAKHAGTTKHVAGKGKHHPAKAKKAATHHHAAKKQPVHTAAKGHKVAKPRKLAWADVPVRAVITPFASRGRVDGAAAWADPLADVACCPVLALAESLKLSGRLCGADDVLALYGHLASDADAGATILATLEAAAEYGLAGVRPLSYHGGNLMGAEADVPEFYPAILGEGRHEPQDRGLQADRQAEQFFGQHAASTFLELPNGLVDPVHVAPLAHLFGQFPLTYAESAAGGADVLGQHVAVGGHARNSYMILGLELPGPHAVLAERGRWWSWSQPWPPAAFPDAVIEEAWAVVWP